MTFQMTDPITDVHYHESSVEDFSRVRSHLEGDDWSVQTWTDPPGAYHSPHDHPYSHRVLCRTGWIEFTVDGESYRLAPGDTLDLPRKVTHEATSNPDVPTEYWLLRKNS